MNPCCVFTNVKGKLIQTILFNQFKINFAMFIHYQRIFCITHTSMIAGLRVQYMNRRLSGFQRRPISFFESFKRFTHFATFKYCKWLYSPRVLKVKAVRWEIDIIIASILMSSSGCVCGWCIKMFPHLFIRWYRNDMIPISSVLTSNVSLKC